MNKTFNFFWVKLLNFKRPWFHGGLNCETTKVSNFKFLLIFFLIKQIETIYILICLHLLKLRAHGF